MKRIALTAAIAVAFVAAIAPTAAGHTLGWEEAKRAAKRVTNSFPIYVERRKVDWCNRWSTHEIHCGVTGWSMTYDDFLEEMVQGDTCSATAIVKKRDGSNRKYVRKRDQSCYYE